MERARLLPGTGLPLTTTKTKPPPTAIPTSIQRTRLLVPILCLVICTLGLLAFFLDPSQTGKSSLVDISPPTPNPNRAPGSDDPTKRRAWPKISLPVFGPKNSPPPPPPVTEHEERGIVVSIRLMRFGGASSSSSSSSGGHTSASSSPPVSVPPHKRA